MATRATDSFKIGEWAEITKKRFGKHVGTLAVIASKENTQISWEGEKETFVEIVCLDSDGNGDNIDILVEDIKKIVPPKFLVAWSTPYVDPMQYFKTKEDADAFVEKLRKRRGEKKVIEVGVYKRVN